MSIAGGGPRPNKKGKSPGLPRLFPSLWQVLSKAQTRAFHRAWQAERASSSGASLQITGSQASSAPSPPAGLLPGAHPLPVAPAVRAEQGDLLPFQLGLAAFEHGGEFALLQLLAAHRGAAKGDGVKAVTRDGSNSAAVSRAASPPAPVTPSATAPAMASVFPVPLQ